MRRALGWARARPWVLRALLVLPALVLVAIFEVSGLRGVNFGYHWDEAGWHLDPGHNMVETGVFLPKSYIYPSFDKWLVVLPAVPRGLREAWVDGGPLAIQAAMLSTMNAPGYKLDVRGVFVVVSSLAILWVYGAALALRHKQWEACLAAAGLGLSWQFEYHSRWAVTDCILVQFSALTVFLIALFQRTGKPRWLYAAAVSAGMSFGTKYTGIFLFAPLLLAGFYALPWNAYRAQAKRAFTLLTIALVVFVVTTPAAVLDPFMFFTETHGISRYYMHSHGGYTAKSGWDHARIVLNFLSLAFYSPWMVAAVALFCATVLGAISWARKDWRMASLLVAFPLSFLVLFCARYRVVVVRNYLFLTPFFALLLARGVSDFVAWLPRRWMRMPVFAALGALYVAQAVWLITSGESIRHFDENAYVRQALAYVSAHASTQFRVSGKVRASARQQKLALPSNVVEAPAGDQVIYWGQAEGPNPWHMRVNDPFLTKAVFGPREMDFNWYSTWEGADHLVVMDRQKASSTGVALAR